MKRIAIAVIMVANIIVAISVAEALEKKHLFSILQRNGIGLPVSNARA